MVSDARVNVASSDDQCSEETEDVKVCDICGDVGEEKKLSVCSRCNDGAEHIYCMRVMLQEVQDGDWLCEECQTKLDIEKQKKKLEKFQAKPAEISLEKKADDDQVGNKELSKASHGKDTSSKREDEVAGVRNAPSSCTSTFIVKADDSGSCIGGSEAVNKNEACHDCEETSNKRSNVFNFKSVDGERHRSEWSNNSVSRISEVKDASNLAVRHKYSNKESEVKSSKQIEDVKVCDICGDVGEEKKLAICTRCNDGAEHIYCMQVMIEEVPEVEWLCEACQIEVEIEKKQEKVGTSKRQFLKGQMSKPVNATNRSSTDNDVLDENMSSKGSKKGNQNYCMATKMTEEDAVINEPVAQNFPECGSLPIEVDSRKRSPPSCEISVMSDAKKGKEPTGQTPTSSASSALKNQAPPLHGKLTKSMSFNNSKIPKVKQLVNEVPLKPKKPKESFRGNMKQEWPMSTIAKSTSFKKSNYSEPANKSRTAILPHAEEPRVMNSLASRNVGNYRGTSTLGCPSVIAPTVAPVPSKAGSAAQHLTKGNSMIDSNNLTIAHGQSSRNSLGHRDLKKPFQAKGQGGITLTSAERTSGMLGSGAQRRVIQIPGPTHQDEKIMNPPNLRPGDSSSSCPYYNTKHRPRGGSVDCSAVSSDLEGKTLFFSSQDHSPSYEQIASNFPDLNYVWKGGFELWKTGRSSKLCEGLQAHLSCSASLQVLEAAKKFPAKIQLQELPCQNLWAPQFQENGPAYGSIGLFFFAQDTESYENHYSKLVENMVKDGLALRGNVGTAELLIFTSNMLPKNFQRWNMFYYLWGVFRVRRKDLSNLPPDESISKPLEDQCHDSITARFSTKDNSTINDFANIPKLAYSKHQDKTWDSSNGNGGEVILYANTEPVTSFVSSIHEEELGKESSAMNVDNSEHLMDVHNVNATEMSPGNVDHISHVSGGSKKRSVGMANWVDEGNGKGHKKLKLDNGGSVNLG